MHHPLNKKLKKQAAFVYSKGFYLALVINELLVAIYL